MRLIDADKIMADIASAERSTSKDYILLTIARYIRIQPTIDAEVVVRCKDCKYVIPYESGGFNCLTCPNVDRDVDENWFCADGEKTVFAQIITGLKEAIEYEKENGAIMEEVEE